MNISELVHALSQVVIPFEGIAVLFAFLFLKNYSDKILRYYPYLLLLTFLIELCAGYSLFPTNNSFAYNILAILTFNFYLVLFRSRLAKSAAKLTIIVLMAIVNLSYLAEFVSMGTFHKTPLYAYSIGGVAMIILAGMYFYQKLELDKTISIKEDLLTWISTGLLLFHVGYLPIKLTRIYFEMTDDIMYYLRFLHYILALIMNLCFILGFRWARKNS